MADDDLVLNLKKDPPPEQANRDWVKGLTDFVLANQDDIKKGQNALLQRMGNRLIYSDDVKFNALMGVKISMTLAMLDEVMQFLMAVNQAAVGGVQQYAQTGGCARLRVRVSNLRPGQEAGLQTLRNLGLPEDCIAVINPQPEVNPEQ